MKHRLEMTDLELQKTNATLRRLGDEMRSYSQVLSLFIFSTKNGLELGRMQCNLKPALKSSRTANFILSNAIINSNCYVTIRQKK